MRNGSALALKISIIALILVLTIAVYMAFFYKDSQISETQILTSVNLALEFYCSEMQAKAGSSNCAICEQSFLTQDKNSKSKYEIIKEDNHYLVKAQIYMVSNQDNKEASFADLDFTVDKKGNLIGSQIPVTQECFEDIAQEENKSQQTILTKSKPLLPF